MKFWKTLSSLIEQTLPDWRDKFLSYKDLKKQLKLICPKDAAAVTEDHTHSNIDSNSDNSNLSRPIKRPRFGDVGDNAAESGARVKSGDCTEERVEDREIEAAAVEATTDVERKEVNEFVKLLEDEIEKFNAFFVEKEEEYVIRLKA